MKLNGKSLGSRCRFGTFRRLRCLLDAALRVSLNVPSAVFLSCLGSFSQAARANPATTAGSSTEAPSTSPEAAFDSPIAPGNQTSEVGPPRPTFEEMESDWKYVAPAPPVKKSSGRMWKGFENSHACPEPSPAPEERGLDPYERFMNRALGLPAKPDELLVIRISPSFRPDSTLSLVHKTDGSYRLRSRRLIQHVWAEMMGRMQEEQGSVIRLDKGHQASALSGLTTSKSVKERRLDNRTADLMLRLWTALAGRAQRVREIGVHTATLDGTYYRIWQGGHWISTYSPKAGSVLYLAVSAAEHLEYFVVEGPTDEDSLLEEARFEMTNALQRTRRREACLEAVSGWRN